MEFSSGSTFDAVSTGVITAEALTITAVVNTKIYDGTTSAAGVPAITSGSLRTGDTANFIENYSTRNVGTGLTLTPSGTVNDGNGGHNYTYTFDAVSTGVITAEALTITAVANTKTFDGTTSAAGVPTIAAGILRTGDTANLIENYSTRNVGTGLTLTPSGTVNDGHDGHNYTYTFEVLSTGVITAEALTITAVANTKTYDRTTSAAAVPTITSGSLGTGDNADFFEAYITRNAGTGLSLTPSGTVNDGNGGHNYTYTFNASPTGVITAEGLTITAMANTKNYDGTTSAAGVPTITSGILRTGDTANFIETYGTRNAGTGVTLTPSGTTNDGNGGHNYTYTFDAVSTGVITAEALTITAVADNKTYDGTTSAAGVPTITSGSLRTGDTADFSETYNTRNVGTGLTLTPSGTVNDGNGGKNYTINTETATGTITPAALIVRANDFSTVYGSPLPVVTETITGFVGGDTSSVVRGAPVLATTAAPGANAGAYSITVAAGTLSATNYVFLAAELITGTLTVKPAPLVIAAVSTSILVGQAVPALTAVYTGFVDGDTAASLTRPPILRSVPTSPSAPGNYPITVSGASSPNYTITYVPGTLTVIVAPATVESVSIQKIKLSKHKMVRGIVLQFSEALDSADAQHISAYTLVTVQKNEKQKSKPVPISRANYNSLAFKVTLLTRKPLALNPPLDLTVKAASLLDALGRELDGNDSGQSGANFTAVLSKAGTSVTSARPLARIGGLSSRAVDAVLTAGLLTGR
jgi:hypothetical protein